MGLFTKGMDFRPLNLGLFNKGIWVLGLLTQASSGPHTKLAALYNHNITTTINPKQLLQPTQNCCYKLPKTTTTNNPKQLLRTTQNNNHKQPKTTTNYHSNNPKRL